MVVFSAFFPNKRRKLCFVINMLNNKTIILLKVLWDTTCMRNCYTSAHLTSVRGYVGLATIIPKNRLKSYPDNLPKML